MVWAAAAFLWSVLSISISVMMMMMMMVIIKEGRRDYSTHLHAYKQTNQTSTSLPKENPYFFLGAIKVVISGIPEYIATLLII